MSSPTSTAEFASLANHPAIAPQARQRKNTQQRRHKGFRLSLSQRMLATGVKALWSASPRLASTLSSRYFRRPRRRIVNYALPEGAEEIAVYHGLTRLTGYRWQGGPQTVLLVRSRLRGT